MIIMLTNVAIYLEETIYKSYEGSKCGWSLRDIEMRTLRQMKAIIKQCAEESLLTRGSKDSRYEIP